MPVRRRTVLLGAAGLGWPARLSAAIAPAEVAGLLLPGNAERIREAIAGGRIVVAPWGSTQEGLFAAATAGDGDDLTVGLLREGDPATVAAGPISIEALTIDPFWSTILTIERQHPLARFPVVAVGVSNGYTSTGRSTWTKALHLFLRRREALLPTFGCMLEARHSEQIGPRGQRLNWTRQYAVAAVDAARADGLPDLLVRDARTRVAVSRHRWRGDAYHPPLFRRLGPFGPG